MFYEIEYPYQCTMYLRLYHVLCEVVSDHRSIFVDMFSAWVVMYY